jgi:hypothetical protein
VPIVERSWCIVVVGFNWGLKKKWWCQFLLLWVNCFFAKFSKGPPPPPTFSSFFDYGSSLGGEKKNKSKRKKKSKKSVTPLDFTVVKVKNTYFGPKRSKREREKERCVNPVLGGY